MYSGRVENSFLNPGERTEKDPPWHLLINRVWNLESGDQIFVRGKGGKVRKVGA